MKSKNAINFTTKPIKPRLYYKLANYLLQYNDNASKNIQSHASFPTCDRQCANNRGCDMRQTSNKDCQIYYNLQKITPIISPNNNNCHTTWYWKKQLYKHLKYHCHLAVSGK